MIIKDNYLDVDQLAEVKKNLEHSEFPWYYRQDIVDVEDPAYMTHVFFETSNPSRYLPIIQPILNKLNCGPLIQIRSNLVFKQTNPISVGWHTDNRYKNAKTAIFYLQTCNGPTVLKKEKEIFVNSVENRMLVFDSCIEHKAILHTDIKRRIVININYFERENHES
tara:strand:- start:310 stop:807 length:498 start_codon:yes stop_codon:yes gene_type:complete